jgi:hypothetical protein
MFTFAKSVLDNVFGKRAFEETEEPSVKRKKTEQEEEEKKETQCEDAASQQSNSNDHVG